MEVIEKWFESRGWQPFPFQREVWNAYLQGRSGLIHSPTGTGKTYAAWFGPIIEHLSAAENVAGLKVLWITPMRALASDTELALSTSAAELGVDWLVERRTGDTPSSIKKRQREKLPDALITTPESLSIMLSYPDSDAVFENLQCVVVDEWHELLSTKRGVQTELALARLRQFRPEVRTWGISATIGNLEGAMRALLGTNANGEPCLVRGHIPKAVKIRSLLPDTIERFPWAGHLGITLLEKVISEIEERPGTALVFTNTRSQTEIWYRAILEARPEWAGAIAVHHGSLDANVRRWVESQLASGDLKCVVCTASLDLGVDFSPVDKVVQIGSPKGVARLLQRAGRSGHQPGAVSTVVCVPTNALELIEFAAARAAAQEGKIEARNGLRKPLDVLSQHLVTIAAGPGFYSDELLAEVRTTNAYHDISQTEWDWALRFVTSGGPSLQTYPEYQKVSQLYGKYYIADSRLAKRHRMSIGTITSDASIVLKYLKSQELGTVEESFIARLKKGDRFVFAGKVLEFVRVRDMAAWVRNASSSKGVVPRWQGGRLPLSDELSAAIRAQLQRARERHYDTPEMACVQPLLLLQEKWSKIPEEGELLIERTQSREGHHLFFYPFEGSSVHEGMAAILAYRLSRLSPNTFGFSVNDYGFELLSPEPAQIEEALEEGLFSTHNLAEEILNSLNSSELARRQFREIARVAGLVFQGYPGRDKSAKQIQATSGLLYDVLRNHEPDNLLLQQARHEVLERQLQEIRLARAFQRISEGRIGLLNVRRPTPLALPLLVERFKGKLSSEDLEHRVARMRIQLERAADSWT